MNASVYQINKGINKSIEFRGLKAQYIWWLGGGMICLLILFAVMYIAGLNPFVCIGIVFTLGGILIRYVYKMSAKYGEHGMTKKMARSGIPKIVKTNSRKVFLKLK